MYSSIYLICVVICFIYCWFLAHIDYTSLRLPNHLTLSFWLLGLLINTHSVFITLQNSFIDSLFCFICFSSIAWLYRKIRRRDGLGGGDIKLLSAFSAWFGFYATIHCVIVACVICIIIRLSISIKQGKNSIQQRFAFESYLIIGMTLHMFFQYVF